MVETPKRGGPIWGAVAWICGGNREAGQKALNSLLKITLSSPSAQGSYGNGMDIAIAYDLLGDHPDWTIENFNTSVTGTNTRVKFTKSDFARFETYRPVSSVLYTTFYVQARICQEEKLSFS